MAKSDKNQTIIIILFSFWCFSTSVSQFPEYNWWVSKFRFFFYSQKQKKKSRIKGTSKIVKSITNFEDNIHICIHTIVISTTAINFIRTLDNVSPMEITTSPRLVHFLSATNTRVYAYYYCCVLPRNEAKEKVRG